MNVIQNVLSWFYKARSEDFVVHWLNPDQVPDKLERRELTPDAAYLRVDLRSLRIVHVQKGLTRFYAMASSHITLPHLGQGEAVFQTIIAPPELKDVEAKNIDRFLSFNRPLVGPVPFRGGDVSLQVGLFSVVSANLLTPYVTLLEEISKMGSVEFINVALPYTDLIAKGINFLTGTTNPQTLEIGVSTSFEQVSSGWLLVMRAPRAEFSDARLNKLTVAAADSKLLEGTVPVANYPYMLLRFSSSPTRDDWFKVPELLAQSQLFNDVLRKGNANEVRPALAAFERFLRTCPDILTADADKVAKKARAEVDRLYPPDAKTAAILPAAGLDPLPLEEYRIYD